MRWEGIYQPRGTHISTSLYLSGIQCQQQVLYTDTIYNTIYNLSRARSNTRDVLALIVVLATSDLNISPGPVRATRATADNGNVVAVRGNGAGARDVLNSQAGDGEVGGWVSVEVAAVVVLFDQNTVPVLVRLMRFIGLAGLLVDGVEGDARVGHALDFTGLAGLGFDADTWLELEEYARVIGKESYRCQTWSLSSPQR